MITSGDASASTIEEVASAGRRDCDAFLQDNEIRVQPLVREAHFLASRVWRKYRAQGGKRDSILADFLIGAHATADSTEACFPPSACSIPRPEYR
jgi:predicted nucleic acid-binding protein